MWCVPWHPEEKSTVSKIGTPALVPWEQMRESRQGLLGLPGHAKDTLPQAAALNLKSGVCWNFRLP